MCVCARARARAYVYTCYSYTRAATEAELCLTLPKVTGIVVHDSVVGIRNEATCATMRLGFPPSHRGLPLLSHANLELVERKKYYLHLSVPSLDRSENL